MRPCCESHTHTECVNTLRFMFRSTTKDSLGHHHQISNFIFNFGLQQHGSVS